MNIDQNWKHPIILPCRHRFTDLLVMSTHLSLGCGGVNYAHHVLREKYWIVNSKSTIKRILKTCIKCRVMHPTIKDQLVSPLPPERVNVTECFSHVAMDLSGVLYTTDRIRMESEVVTQHNKRYYLLLVCFFTRLLHVELLMDRTTDEILNGLRRAFARRGRPNFIYCDGEKGFKRVSMELHNVYTSIDLKQIKRGLNDEGVEFLFNIPMSPHRGGATIY